MNLLLLPNVLEIISENLLNDLTYVDTDESIKLIKPKAGRLRDELKKNVDLLSKLEINMLQENFNEYLTNILDDEWIIQHSNGNSNLVYNSDKLQYIVNRFKNITINAGSRYFDLKVTFDLELNSIFNLLLKKCIYIS